MEYSYEPAYQLARLLVVFAYSATSEPTVEPSPGRRLRHAAVTVPLSLLPGNQPAAARSRVSGALDNVAECVETARRHGSVSDDAATQMLDLRERIEAALAGTDSPPSAGDRISP